MAHTIQELLARLSGRYRQTALTRALGQVTCSTDPAAHNLENLPCKNCGAAL